MLSICQFGFRSGLSTLTQLINAQALIVDNFNQLKCVDGEFTDLSKAFDTITYRKLLLQLRARGIHGHLYNWITSFLTDRLQFVSVNLVTSILKPCTSDVLQGSILSSILFLLCISVLPECVKHSCLFLYTDDAKVLKPIIY